MWSKRAGVGVCKTSYRRSVCRPDMCQYRGECRDQQGNMQRHTDIKQVGGDEYNDEHTWTK